MAKVQGPQAPQLNNRLPGTLWKRLGTRDLRLAFWLFRATICVGMPGIAERKIYQVDLPPCNGGILRTYARIFTIVPDSQSRWEGAPPKISKGSVEIWQPMRIREGVWGLGFSVGG